MKTKITALLGIVIISTAISGCGEFSNQDVGLVGGAVAGGVIGNAVTGNSAVGTVVGAAAGAYAGQAIGRHYDNGYYY